MLLGSSPSPKKPQSIAGTGIPAGEGAAGPVAGQMDTCGQRAAGHSWAQLVFKVTGVSVAAFCNRWVSQQQQQQQLGSTSQTGPGAAAALSCSRQLQQPHPGRGYFQTRPRKTTRSSSESEYFIFPLDPEGLGAALGAALDAQITEHPSGMLRAPACQREKVVKKTKSIFSLPGTAAHGRKRFLSCSFSVLGWLLAGLPAPGPAQPPGTTGAFQALAAAKQPLLNYGIFFRFLFYFNGNFIIILKEIINS